MQWRLGFEYQGHVDVGGELPLDVWVRADPALVECGVVGGWRGD